MIGAAILCWVPDSRDWTCLAEETKTTTEPPVVPAAFGSAAQTWVCGGGVAKQSTELRPSAGLLRRMTKN